MNIPASWLFMSIVYVVVLSVLISVGTGGRRARASETTYLLIFELAAGDIRRDSVRTDMGHMDFAMTSKIARKKCGERGVDGEIGLVFWETWLRSNSWRRTVSTICWQKREGRSLVQILIRSERKAWRERRASWTKEGRDDRHESKKKVIDTGIHSIYTTRRSI